MDLQYISATASTIILEARERLLAIVDSGDLQAIKKADNSFVTRADKETEQFIRATLAETFPDHNILGEEFPTIDKGSSYTWVIDPIDGTHSFKQGIPLYGTLLCLMEDKTPLVSVIDLPALGRQYVAAKGCGVMRNGVPVTLAPPASSPIEDEVIATGERAQFVSCGLDGLFDKLMAIHPHVRTYCDCFGHTLAIEGVVGAMVDFDIRIWDCMATVLFMEEAGGKAVCVGTRMDAGQPRYDWVFGKPEVVDWVCDTLNLSPVAH
ncbi:MAG: inositol monophosphatase [Bacteroidota bacterium]